MNVVGLWNTIYMDSRCRRRINPQDYLTDVLGRLPALNLTQIAELLPANWKPAVPSPG